MSFDTTAVNALFNSLVSHALNQGLFDRVATHEPKNAPGNGLTCVFWVQNMQPVAAASGLAATSLRVEFTCRIYSNMLQEPQDSIDPNMLAAAAILLSEYSGNFTMGGTVRDVDLLGAHGSPLSAQAAYVNQDNRLYRIFEITLPIIINDAFAEGA